MAAGTLVDANGRLSDVTTAVGSTTVDANARLQYNGTGDIRALYGEGTVASAGLTLGGGEFSGVIEGGALAVRGGPLGGTGTLILSGNNTYTGGTDIDNGNTLQVGAGADTGTLGSGNVTNDGSLVFNRSNEHTVGNVIVGSGSLRQSGSGKLVLTGDNGYGSTIIDSTPRCRWAMAARAAAWARAR